MQSNQAPVAVASASPTSGAAPLTVDFSSAGSVDPEGQPLDLLLGLRRRHHVDRSQPDPHLHASPVGTPPGSPCPTASNHDDRRRRSTISAGNPPTATIQSPTDGIFFVGRRRHLVQRQRHRPRGRDAARVARSPGTSTSFTRATSIPAHRSPASRAGRSRSRRPGTTSAATRATGSRSRSPTSSGLTSSTFVIIWPTEGQPDLRHGPAGSHALPRRHRQDDAVRLRHARRVQPHDRGPRPDRRTRPRTRSPRGPTAARDSTSSSSRRPPRPTPPRTRPRRSSRHRSSSRQARRRHRAT